SSPSRDVARDRPDDDRAHGRRRRARDREGSGTEAVPRRRQNRNGRQGRRWAVFRERLQRVICRIRTLPPAGAHDSRRHRHAEEGARIWRRGRRANLPEDRRGRAAAGWCDAVGESRGSDRRRGKPDSAAVAAQIAADDYPGRRPPGHAGHPGAHAQRRASDRECPGDRDERGWRRRGGHAVAHARRARRYRQHRSHSAAPSSGRGGERSMTLGALTAAVRSLAPDARARIERAGRTNLVVTGVTHDSRAAASGVVFVAIRGQRTDGAQFAAEAARRGAAAIVAETPEPPGLDVPWLRTPDARLAMAELAGQVYGQPSESLTVVGVTGTNGKTTTTYLLAAVFDAAGLPCGRI